MLIIFNRCTHIQPRPCKGISQQPIGPNHNATETGVAYNVILQYASRGYLRSYELTRKKKNESSIIHRQICLLRGKFRVFPRNMVLLPGDIATNSYLAIKIQLAPLA